MDIKQMDDVIQNHCYGKHCGEDCIIRDLCNKAGGEFDTHPIECAEAYYRITGQTTNAVNHPIHYNKGKIEVWDFISDWKLNFDRGNAIKYLCRAGEKDPNAEIQDLEKAIAYINHEIKILKGEIENGND
jgi:hypothetical protein